MRRGFLRTLIAFIAIFPVVAACARAPEATPAPAATVSNLPAPAEAVSTAAAESRPGATIPPASATPEPVTPTRPAATPPTTATRVEGRDATAAAPRPSPSPVAKEPAPLFGPPWGEREVYEAALIPAERDVLEELSGVSEYRIEARISPDYLTFSARQQVRYTNTEDGPLSEIYFRLFPNAMGGEMQIGEVLVDGVRREGRLELEDSAFVVPLEPPLPAGQPLVVELGYAIRVPQDPKDGYGLLSYSEGILALDSPYPMIPVFDDEGWNVETPPDNADTSYNDMSLYLVRLTAPRALTVVTAGVEIDRVQHNGSQVNTYAAGPARDFFIAASENYQVATQQMGDVTVRSFAPKERAEEGRAVLGHAVGALESFNRRFGPYPYSELDLAATPMLALGIEYPGVMGIATRLYGDERVAGRPAKEVVQSTVAHEIAHQWFYNLIGSDQVDEPWLDEAMAQFATGLYFSDVGGKTAEEAYSATWYGRWDRVDRAAKAVGLPAEAYDGAEYSAIVYGRGPLFVNELRAAMGEAAFNRFLRDYATKFRWDIATTEGFKATAEAACGCALDKLFAEWVYQ